MKRIALVHWALPPVIGGVESHIVDLAQGLRSSGYDVFIVSGQRAPTRKLFPGIRLYYAPELDLDRICAPRGGYDREPVLAQVLNEIQPDVVHAHNLDHFDLAALRLLTAMEQRHRYVLCHSFHSLLGLPEAKELLELWHVHHAVSDYVAKAVNLKFGFTARMLHLPVNIMRFPVSRRAFTRLPVRILHPTRIVPEKGVIRTLHLVRHLLDSGTDVTLTLTSGTPAIDWKGRTTGYLAEVISELQRLKLERHILFQDAPYAAMPGLYANSDLVVYPSEFEEPLGLVPLEAMASGRMIIASRRGGVLESVVDSETGILFDPHDPDAFIADVISALDDRGRAEVIAKNGRRKIADGFNLSQYIHALTAVYSE